MSETVTLGGRFFEITDKDDLTFDQHVWLEVATLEANLGPHLLKKLAPILEKAVAEDKDPSPEAAEEFAHDMVIEACRDGKHLDILAGMFTEIGTPWTRKTAEENREFFANLKGENIQPMMQMLQQAIVAFFFSGLDSLRTSESSLSPLEQLSSVRMGMGESGLGDDSGRSDS